MRKKLFTIIMIVILIKGYITLINNYEMISSTARYQLYNDIVEGNQEAIDFYKKQYLDRGIILFDDIEL